MLYLKTGIERPLEFISSGQFISNVPWTHSRRSIDDFEIIIGVNKCLHISTEDTDYEVRPGNVLLLLPKRVHGGNKVCEKEVSFFWFHFAPASYELIDDAAMEQEVAEIKKPDSERRISNIYIPLFFTPQGIEKINIMFQQLQHVVNSNYYTLQSANYVMTSLLIELSEQTITDYFLTQQKSEGERHIAEIIEWIRIHAMSDISVSDIAEKFNYNRDYLSRVFKRRTGINLQEYIHLMKISKAKDMLSRSRKSIKEISKIVGIDDEKYFMRLFKKYENITPTEYRTAFYRTHLNNH
ncbi:AraC family transcriptional regulator [Paenibacillus alkalitolerans]|uniref:AraC family transcriptional regulator n=1 Tax=Paenibacillus alkalitolerans TaxID=2799335 RepID=UPI0018F6AE29|nr:AraC family transcriptional regulator [Paenibacillus alkalitolerans]